LNLVTADGVTQQHKVEPLAVTQVEAARMLRVSPRTIHNWARRGILTPRRIGGVVRYARRDVVRLVAKERVKA
jgi:DNA-binding transcriptional MerR regulator